MSSERLLGAAQVAQDNSEALQCPGEFGLVGGVCGGQFPPQAECFLSGGQRLLGAAARVAQVNSEVLQCPGEFGLVGGVWAAVPGTG